jgi:glycosyltransferase involved in cell wall biosynthesis
MNSLVSILIPVYNSEKWLSETLESALAQTWHNKEIIVINDGSTDSSLAIAKAHESSIVKVIDQENCGQSAAENHALREAQGDFIQYLDADDLLAPDKIERQVQLLENPNTQFIASSEWARFYKSPTEALFIPQPLWRDMPSVDWLVCAWENNLMMHGAAWLIPRHIVAQAGPWNEKLSLINDFDYFSRVLLASRGIQFCWGAKTYYRSGIDGSLSGSKSHSAWESAFLSLEIGTSNLLSVEDSDRTRHACATEFQRFIYEAYPEVPELCLKAEVNVQKFGGTDIKPLGGSVFQLLANIVGWKNAKRIQVFAHQHGYNKAAIGRRLKQVAQKLYYHLNPI